MIIYRTIDKIFSLSINKVLWFLMPSKNTRFIVSFLKRNGAIINGMPNYLSAKIWFDGTDYSLIELNEGCTISSNVRILTHDWSITTVARAMGHKISDESPIGIFRKVRVGPYSFVGTGSILMPGCDVGEGAIVGAGTVVRGTVEPYSIVIGNPCVKVGDSREYLKKQLNRISEGNTSENSDMSSKS